MAILDRFLASLAPMREDGKLGAVVLQFPASFRARESARLVTLLGAVPREIPLAVELRHGSWWTNETRALLSDRGAVLVWSVLPDIRPPPWVTGDFLYARFIGDRALTTFDRVQRDGRGDMEAMRQLFDKEGRASITVFAYSNNHFMGFGPGTVEVLADVLGEPHPVLDAATRLPGQSRLEDARSESRPEG
jgi:uncharacterized protein YecE (DUF72 family)